MYIAKLKKQNQWNRNVKSQFAGENRNEIATRVEIVN